MFDICKLKQILVWRQLYISLVSHIEGKLEISKTNLGKSSSEPADSYTAVFHPVNYLIIADAIKIKILSQFQRSENIDIKTWYGFILWEKFFNK